MKRGLTMTLAEAEAHQAKHGFRKALPSAVDAPTTASKAFRLPKCPNKTESEFGLMLEARKRAGEFDKITFEGATLRLADRLRYTPDWMCERPGDAITYRHVTFFEVKGGWIDGDSVPKFKMAREQHKWAHFEMWQKKAGTWTRLL